MMIPCVEFDFSLSYQHQRKLRMSLSCHCFLTDGNKQQQFLHLWSGNISLTNVTVEIIILLRQTFRWWMCGLVTRFTPPTFALVLAWISCYVMYDFSGLPYLFLPTATLWSTLNLDLCYTWGTKEDSREKIFQKILARRFQSPKAAKYWLLCYSLVPRGCACTNLIILDNTILKRITVKICFCFWNTFLPWPLHGLLF